MRAQARRGGPRGIRPLPGAVVATLVGLMAVACGAPAAPPASPTPCPTPTSASSTPTTSTPAPTPTGSPTSATPCPSPTPTRTTTPAPTTTKPSPPPSTTRPPAPTPTGIPAALVGQDVRVIPTSRRVVALTFDGGSNDAGLASILATLEAEGVRATFFLTGRFVEVYPDGARAIAAAGHVIGNHTQTHPHSTQITDAALTAEVLTGAATIRAATGVQPRPWFRFPYGERTYADVLLLNDLGYVCVSWTVDTLGWLGTERGTASDVTARVLATLQPGEIVLMHVGANPDDGTTYDADALAATIHAIRDAGYSFTTVESLLG